VSSLATTTEPTNGTGPTAALLENLPDAIVLVDESGAVQYANAAAERLFGYSIGELVSRRLPELLAEPFRGEYEAALRGYALHEQVPMLGERREVVCRRPDGSAANLELSLSEVRVGLVRSLVLVGRDIREEDSTEERTSEGADHDSLTGLLNRVGFENALTRHVDYSARYGSAGSVIALGIDTFKYLNETLGSAGGDELLTGLVGVIQGRLRKTDVLARVGGDVFGVLVHGADKTKALVVAEELLELVRRHAFVVKGEPVRFTMSAGVTAVDEREVTGGELLAEAETAMHSAKEAGRDRVLGFDADVREDDEQRVWTERVRQATERGLFVLTCQPIVELGSGETTQYEILLRMRDDGGGLVEPSAFLATAERFGLIGGVDRWVTQQAVRLIEAHNREGRDLTLEVNLSGHTMGDANFPDDVKKQLATAQIDPANLVFEVTETAAVADVEQARSFAQSLARLGCRFALDDFGAGYASFYYLKHLPISYLKIDGEFVKNLANDRTDQLIVKALVDVCEGLEIKTIAEFVGDQQTMDMVGELGVDFAQGYHLGKPEPTSSLRAATAG
jgi:diguanylate cyclase (GGDEF)-like protein/PAS domain S-box-containing protein